MHKPIYLPINPRPYLNCIDYHLLYLHCDIPEDRQTL